MTLFLVFVTGILLWVIGGAMAEQDEKKREERVQQRLREWRAWRDAKDARWRAMIDEIARPPGNTSP